MAFATLLLAATRDTRRPTSPPLQFPVDTPGFVTPPARVVDGHLDFEPHRRDRDDGHPLPWAPNCKIQHPCPPSPALERCPRDLTPIDASTLDIESPGRLGELLAVRGPLGLGSIWTTEVGCLDPFHPGRREKQTLSGCCNSVGAEAFVGVFPHAIVLDDFGCGGDDSRLCCGARAFGKTVVAVGTLARERGFQREGVYWRLEGVRICEEGVRDRRAFGCQVSVGQ